jgi:hypothetical protein
MKEDFDSTDIHRVQSELRGLKGEAGRWAKAVRDAGIARAEATRAYEQRRALIRKATTGTVQAKDDAATTDDECAQLWLALETARVAEGYSKRMAEAVKSDLSNVQTQANMIRTMMGLAGVDL